MDVQENVDPFVEENDDITITVTKQKRPPDVNEFIITRSENIVGGEFNKVLGNTGLAVSGNVGFEVNQYNDIMVKTEDSYELLFNVKIHPSVKRGKGKRQIVIRATNLGIVSFDRETFKIRPAGQGEQRVSLRKNTCNLCLRPYTIKSIHTIGSYHTLQTRTKHLINPKSDSILNHITQGLFLNSSREETVHWKVTPDNQVFPLDLHASIQGNVVWDTIVYFNKTQGIRLKTDLYVQSYENQVQVVKLAESPVGEGVNKSGVSLEITTKLPIEADLSILYEINTNLGPKTIRLKLWVTQGVTKDFQLEKLEQQTPKPPPMKQEKHAPSWLGTNYLVHLMGQDLEKFHFSILNHMEQETLKRNNSSLKVTPLDCPVKEQQVKENWQLLLSPLTKSNYVNKLLLLVHIEFNNHMKYNPSYKVRSINSVAKNGNTETSRLILNVTNSTLGRLNLKTGHQVYFESPEQRFTGCLELTGEQTCSFIIDILPQDIDTQAEFTLSKMDNKFLSLVYISSLILTKRKNLVDYWFPTQYEPKGETVTAVTFHQRLSLGQEETVKKALNHPTTLPFIITGPAGTGKSFILLEVVLQLLERQPDKRILLVNPTNHGLIDLHRKLSDLLETHMDKKFRTLKIASPSQPKGPTCDHCYLNTAGTHHEYPPPEYITQFAVLLCTPTVAFRLGYLEGLKLNLSAIIVDEACFLTEPDTLTAVVPHLSASDENKPLVVLAGDIVQLTYQPRSTCAKLGEYGTSTMKRLSSLDLYKTNPNIFIEMWLSYRNPKVMVSLMNKLGYQDKVVSAVTTHTGKVFACHSTSIAKKAQGDKSTYSDVEAATCLYYASLCRQNNPKKSIVILCCYVAQVAIFKQLQRTMFPVGGAEERFKAVTTETIQGSEADIVFLCPTIQGSYPKGPANYSWPANKNRLTMSVSRAKSQFYLVGDLLLLNRIHSFKEVIDQATAMGNLICDQNIKDLLAYDNG